MVAALILSYALNYRKMEHPVEMAKWLLQALITFPLLYLLYQMLAVDAGIEPRR